MAWDEKKNGPKAKEEMKMEGFCGLRVGQKVPDFLIETFDPETGGFGQIGLEALRRQGKWTVLFFYPADFTFV